MSAQWLGAILGWIRSGGLAPLTKMDVDIDDVLSLRDGSMFDSEWVATNDEVQRRLRDECSCDAQSLGLVEDVAREAFLAIAASSALAPYVSDDLRLIAEAILADYDSPWLAGLLRSYVADEFPAGVVAPSTVGSREIVKALSHRTSPGG